MPGVNRSVLNVWCCIQCSSSPKQPTAAAPSAKQDDLQAPASKARAYVTPRSLLSEVACANGAASQSRARKQGNTPSDHLSSLLVVAAFASAIALVSSGSSVIGKPPNPTHTTAKACARLTGSSQSRKQCTKSAAAEAQGIIVQKTNNAIIHKTS
mmetsp:Transcript_24277/g.55237  ORF Transcript_24277/g.55237 Transcript_24277/m.55237 type:complete len:155 (+) Transcript_24277:1600-2064(+)